jgi:superfamily II DNA or RNA helicase
MIRGDLEFELSEEQLSAYNLALSDFSSFQQRYADNAVGIDIRGIELNNFFYRYQILLRIIYEPASLGLADNPKIYDTIYEWTAKKLAKGEQVILWGWNISLLKKVTAVLQSKGGHRVEILYGLTAAAERDRIIRGLNSGKTDVLVANFASMGTGINLPAATSSLFMQIPNTLAMFYQSMGRHHRIITSAQSLARDQVYSDVLIPAITKDKNIVDLFFRKIKKTEQLYHLLIDMDMLIDDSFDQLVTRYVKNFIENASANSLPDDNCARVLNSFL